MVEFVIDLFEECIVEFCLYDINWDGLVIEVEFMNFKVSVGGIYDNNLVEVLLL